MGIEPKYPRKRRIRMDRYMYRIALAVDNAAPNPVGIVLDTDLVRGAVARLLEANALECFTCAGRVLYTLSDTGHKMIKAYQAKQHARDLRK